MQSANEIRESVMRSYARERNLYGVLQAYASASRRESPGFSLETALLALHLAPTGVQLLESPFQMEIPVNGCDRG